jgi:glycine betaine/choline ABC-type transport system substrate-binding protein
MTSSVRRIARATCCVLVALAASLPWSTVASASTTVSIGAGLRGPSELIATVYAKGLKHASALTADARGRVWVATAAASDKGKDAIYLITRPARLRGRS